MNLFIEGYDHHGTGTAAAAHLAKKWGVMQNWMSVVTGRHGNGLTSTIGPYVTAPWARTPLLNPATNEGVLGYAVKVTGLPYTSDGTIFLELAIWSASGKILSINTSTLGHYVVKRGDFSTGVTLGSTASPLLVNGEWAYIEFMWKIHASSGYIEIRKNNITQLVLTGVNTGSAQWSAVEFIPGIGEIHDDVYVNDLSGSRNNYFIGPQRVSTVFPDAAGDYAQWTPSAGLNHQNVEENPPNDDTDYNRTQFNAQREAYNFQALPVDLGDIKALQQNALVRKEDAAVANQYRNSTRIVLTDYDQPIKNLSGISYLTQRDIQEVNPATGLPWTRAEIDAAQFGGQRVA
jgi:hypothetical protein